jgi:sulfite exporter TauE/SafE
MLASIHPLGERARHNRWVITAAAYLCGSVAAGALLGALLGAAGSAAPTTSPVRLVALAALCGAAAAIDASGLELPSWRRQVNEDWMTTYRGWAYGAAFGSQLGLGVATIVTTATVYVWLAAATLTASAGAGVAVGAAFGLARAVPVLALARVHGPAALRRAHGRLARWSGPVRLATAAAFAGVAALSAAAVRA